MPLMSKHIKLRVSYILKRKKRVSIKAHVISNMSKNPLGRVALTRNLNER